ncbi:ankyrin repeat-containing domain protein [Annulohypoxylon nitens]|nr:ankyrin repeat-containing domain protein [Annulohypoxylon nitens]
MADHTAEKILERRRVQNRKAQRRFREKKNLQRTLDLSQHTDHPYRTPDSLIRFSPPIGSPPSFSHHQFGERIATDIPRNTRNWDLATSDPLIGDDGTLFAYNNIPDDTTASHIPSVFPAQKFRTATFDPADVSCGLPTLDSSAGTSMDSLSSVAEANLSPENISAEPPDESLLSPTSQSRSTRSAGGWASPLHIAAKKGSSRIIRMLLQHNSDCDESDSEGLTPLIHAVIGGHEEATLSLLKHGARIGGSRRDGKWARPSAIHWAVLKRREGVLRILLDHCSDPKLLNGYDDLGRAPLHIAIDIEFDAGVGLLLQFGADPSQKARYYQDDV